MNARLLSRLPVLGVGAVFVGSAWLFHILAAGDAAPQISETSMPTPIPETAEYSTLSAHIATAVQQLETRLAVMRKPVASNPMAQTGTEEVVVTVHNEFDASEVDTSPRHEVHGDGISHIDPLTYAQTEKDFDEKISSDPGESDHTEMDASRGFNPSDASVSGELIQQYNSTSDGNLRLALLTRIALLRTREVADFFVSEFYDQQLSTESKIILLDTVWRMAADQLVDKVQATEILVALSADFSPDISQQAQAALADLDDTAVVPPTVLPPETDGDGLEV